MFDALQRFFQSNMAPGEAGDEAHRLRVSTCALLLEAAKADDEFTEEERRTIERLVAQRFELDDQEARDLIELSDSVRRQQKDLYRFAKLINENYTRARKLAVIELLWSVVLSDGVLVAHEDALMHKVARLLGLRNQELIAVKLRVRKALDEGAD